LRQALHGPVELSRHPLRIIIVVVVTIVFIGGLFLRLPFVP
jgi:hypothetical protein